MLKEQIENIETQLQVFPDFKQISLQRGDMTTVLQFLKQLQAIGDLTELLAVLQAAWEKSATCTDKEDCQGAIERLRDALDVYVER
ncbi:hypothetical protein ASL14_26430 (plasmid) [Paenibacillus sp. IHB B 3084]|uniref:hypothetical protein n=1 Tax=Paenibacillus sp. IHB B 3084 TaxID=867076 RepID=UPI00072073BB|nr:hypothetical protein [Paenibacillus sp. IHB B 3084]ALP39414.1 hypothetical protein ASL14_26430 [Paenibacillus sp. IHB B 3084]